MNEYEPEIIHYSEWVLGLEERQKLRAEFENSLEKCHKNSSDIETVRLRW